MNAKEKKFALIISIFPIAAGVLLLQAMPLTASAAFAISQPGGYSLFTLPAPARIYPGDYDDRGTPDCGSMCASQYGQNAVYCGMYSPDVDNQGNPKTNSPDICQLTPGVLAAGLSIPNNGVPGQGWVIDVTGSQSGDQQMPCGGNGVVTGISKTGKDSGTSGGNQVDSGLCQNMVLPPTAIFNSAAYTYYRANAPVPSDTYCPINSLMTGGLDAAGKNDSWDGFICTPIDIPIPDSIGAQPISDNVPSVMNVGQTVTVGTDGQPLNVVMQNVGTDIWQLPQFNYVSTQGSTQYCLTDAVGDGTLNAPSLGTDVLQADGGDHDAGYSPAGSSCTVVYNAGSSDLQLQHAASQFGVVPASASPVSQTFTRTFTVVVTPRVCYGNAQSGRECDGPYANYAVSGNYNIMSQVFSTSTIASGNLYGSSIPANAPITTTFSLGNITAPLTAGTYIESWTLAFPAPGFSFSALPMTFSKTITVLSASSPTVTISANPTSVLVGSPTTLTWTTANAASCTASGAWSGAQAAAATNSLVVTPPAAGSYTYTITCADASGNASLPSSVTVNASAIGNVNVNSVSGGVVGFTKSATLPLVASGASAYCSAGSTMMCGVHSGSDYADSVLNPGPSIKANQPLCCSLSSGVKASGAYTLIDSASNGASFTCPTNEVVMGDYGGSSNQLDRGWCQALSGGFHWVAGTETPAPVSALNTDYYCPSGSLVVGFQYPSNKNDSADTFLCAPIVPGTSADLSALNSVPSSWTFNPPVNIDPCNLGTDSGCTGTSATYSSVPAGGMYTIDPSTVSPTGYVFGGVRSVMATAPETNPTLFSGIWDWLTKVAHAVTVYDAAGNPGQSQFLSSGAAITFVIDWDPVIPPPTVSSVSVSCNPTEITVSQTSQCTANVSGTGSFSPAVTWTVTGGGSIDPLTGLYTAPASLVSAITAKVTATSQQDPTKSSSFNITVDAPVSCSPPSQSINVAANGGTATLTALGGNGATFAWNAGDGPGIPSSGNNSSFTVNYNNPSTAGHYSVGVTSGASQTSCTVHVINLSCTLTSNPKSVIAPSSATLSWTCSNATKCTITSSNGDNFPGLNPVKGTLSVTPTSTATYFLTCSNDTNGPGVNTVNYQVSSNVSVVPISTREP